MKSTGTTTLRKMQVLKQYCDVLYQLLTSLKEEKRKSVKKVKKDCHRCRLLAKRTIEVAMGPVSTYNLTIPPAFYYTQVELAGQI